MASRIISETNKGKRGPGSNKGRKRQQQSNNGGNTNHRTEEDKRVDAEKWLCKDNFEALVADGTLTGHRGNTEGDNRPDQEQKLGTKLSANTADEQGRPTQTDTFLDDIEALRLLWIKEDTSWDTAAVFGEHRKKLRAFSEDYKYRKTKLLGHVIRADNDDPMRKVTFAPNTVEEWGFAQRRVGRPKDQWLHESKKLYGRNADTWKTDKGIKRKNKRTKYKGTPLQDAYIHTWGGERHF